MLPVCIFECAYFEMLMDSYKTESSDAGAVWFKVTALQLKSLLPQKLEHQGALLAIFFLLRVFYIFFRKSPSQ